MPGVLYFHLIEFEHYATYDLFENLTILLCDVRAERNVEAYSAAASK